mmetsp:Transcript_2043/g.3436  ORF Transcript_2043/g.3436 Transcript_2043/m.3436 type:complete len:99 (+) Transcript_2043:986-1282(+)
MVPVCPNTIHVINPNKQIFRNTCDFLARCLHVGIPTMPARAGGAPPRAESTASTQLPHTGCHQLIQQLKLMASFWQKYIEDFGFRFWFLPSLQSRCQI